MNAVRYALSSISRAWAAIRHQRDPKMTLSAEAAWMATYGDTAKERAEGERLVREIDALPFNGPGHCAEALEGHFSYWLKRLDRKAAVERSRAQRAEA